LNMTLSQSSFGGHPQINEQSNYVSNFDTSFSFQRTYGDIKGRNREFKSEGLMVVPMNQNSDFELALPELYYQENWSSFSVTLGRKNQDWSELDKYWKLGVWQPLARWDAANPIEQGLTGLFLVGQNKYVRLTAFASGLFIPDQQPQSEIVNGKIVSTNRWFFAPVDSAKLPRNSTEIYYKLEKPDLSDVISQESYALSIRVGEELTGPMLRLSLANKPQNQFHLVVDSVSQATSISVPPAASIINGASEFPTYEIVYPEVIRQRTAAAEIGYLFESGKFILSYNQEIFDKPEIPTNWTQTELVDTEYYGFLYEQSLRPFHLTNSSVIASYIEKDKGKDNSKESIITGSVQSSSQKFQFEKMASLEYRYNLSNRSNRKWSANFKYTYSLSDLGEWVMAGLQYRADKKWTFAIAGDVFGVPEGTSPETSFISKYRGNDRITGSMTYVF